MAFHLVTKIYYLKFEILGAFDVVFQLIFSRLFLEKENDVYDVIYLKMKTPLVYENENSKNMFGCFFFENLETMKEGGRIIHYLRFF